MDFDQVMNFQKNRLLHFLENKRQKFFFVTKEILSLFGFFFIIPVKTFVKDLKDSVFYQN